MINQTVATKFAGLTVAAAAAFGGYEVWQLHPYAESVQACAQDIGRQAVRNFAQLSHDSNCDPLYTQDFRGGAKPTDIRLFTHGTVSVEEAKQVEQAYERATLPGAKDEDAGTKAIVELLVLIGGGVGATGTTYGLRRYLKKRGSGRPAIGLPALS